MDGLRRIAASAQSCDGYQARIVPAIYNAVLYQLFDITLSGDHVCQIQLCKLDLARRIFKFALPYNPVI